MDDSPYRIPTVKISDGKGDYIIINESDFDEKKHKRFEEKAAGKAQKAAPADDDSTKDPVATAVITDPIEIARRSAVDIPDDWQTKPFLTKKSIAAQIAGNADAGDKASVEAVILGELARRAA